MRFSVHDLESLTLCPRLWVAKRIEDLDRTTRALRVSAACRAACESLTLAWHIAATRDPVVIVREAISEYSALYNLPPEEMHESLEVMENALAGAVSTIPPAGWSARAELELGVDGDFAIQPAESELVEYSARLDRLQWSPQGHIEIVNWKTGHDWVKSEDLPGDAPAQWHSFLALRLFPEAREVRYRRAMLRLGYEATHTFRRGEPWEETIQRRMRLGRLLAMKLKLGDLQPEERYGGGCQHCPRAGACETLATVVAEGGEMFAAASREERARMYAALRDVVNEMGSKLREDVTHNGPIVCADGRTLGLFPNKTRALRVTPREARERLREWGMGSALEEQFFAPSERAMPKIVQGVLEEIMKPDARRPFENALLSPAISFSFEFKKGRS